MRIKQKAVKMICWFFGLAFLLCCSDHNASKAKNTDAGVASPQEQQRSFNMEEDIIEDIPPEIRLRDYKKQMRYPIHSRPAVGESESNVFELPGYQGSSTSDAKITGLGAFRVSNGHVYLPVHLQVQRRGEYRIETLLHRGDGKACLIASKVEELAEGAQTMELQFFGLAFHEGCKTGPWYIEGIVGRKVPNLESLEPGEEPIEAPLAPYKKHLVLKIPNGARLSSKEWDSPTKRTRIAELEQEIREKNRKK